MGKLNKFIVEFDECVPIHQKFVFIRCRNSNKLLNIYKDENGLYPIMQNGIDNTITQCEFKFYCSDHAVNVNAINQNFIVECEGLKGDCDE